MTGAGHLDIGPLRFALRTDGGPVRYADPAYAGFFRPAADLGRSLVELPVEISTGSPEIPTREPLWRAGGHWAVWEETGDYLVHTGLQAPEAARAACRVARDLSRAELRLPPGAWREGACESPLKYPLDQILGWGLLAKIGGVLLHSAVAVKDGVGYVFAGRSGAGKSTLAGFCHAAGWRILNDDRVLVFRRGAEWRVAGTPWHG